jgi:hypothetical protein
MIYTCTPEVLGLSLSREIPAVLTKGVLSFPQSLQANLKKVKQSRYKLEVRRFDSR